MGQLNTKKKDTIREGAPAPLFLRLIDQHPHIKSEQVVKNFLTPTELQSSIANELEIILNTRISAAEEEDTLKNHPDLFRLPDFFGLRDFSAFDLQSTLGHAVLTRKIREVVERFEPRLLKPQIYLIGVGDDKASLIVEIKGEVQIGTSRQQVTFPMTLHSLLQRRSGIAK